MEESSSILGGDYFPVLSMVRDSTLSSVTASHLRLRCHSRDPGRLACLSKAGEGGDSGSGRAHLSEASH